MISNEKVHHKLELCRHNSKEYIIKKKDMISNSRVADHFFFISLKKKLILPQSYRQYWICEEISSDDIYLQMMVYKDWNLIILIDFKEKTT